MSQEVVGPWEFGEYRYLAPSRDQSDLYEEYQEKQLQIHNAGIDGNNMLLNGATLLDMVKKNKDTVPYSNNLLHAKLIETEIAKEKNKNQSKRFWRPVTFYFYGEGGAGKSHLVQKLFGSELYSKSKMQRNGSSWWDNYQGYSIVFLDK